MIHIVGAGLAGLSAAVELASKGASVTLHESAKHAGGRCRSYFDQKLQMEIDNGNHLLLSSNAHALRYLRSIDALDRVKQMPSATFPFVNLATHTRWNLAPSAGPIPLWLLSKGRRAPGANFRDYLGLLRLLRMEEDKSISQIMSCDDALYHNMMRPLLLAALNNEPAEASSALARQLMRDTLMRGAQACKPIIAIDGLSRAFIDPALAFLRKHQAKVRFATRLRDITICRDRATNLRFEDHTVPLAPQDMVILAVPPHIACAIKPGVKAPDAFNAIVNIHFATRSLSEPPKMTGIVGATSEWLFEYPERLSVTISAANRFLETPMEDLAARIWREIAMITGATCDMPPWRILREKRATFAATPEQNRRRPGTCTDCSNLFLAGDWTDTGLPATMEGAIKSGVIAACKAYEGSLKGTIQAHADHG